MFTTAKKFVIIPAMIGLGAAIVAANPAMAETMAETEMTPAANCLPLAMETTGECIPLPTLPIRRTAAPSIANPEAAMDMANEFDTAAPDMNAQPTQLSSIEALNTPEALSQIPMLPAIIQGNVAEVPEDIDFVAQDPN